MGLLLAAQDGHAGCVEALLAKGADANQANPQNGNSPLLMAAKNRHAWCTKFLVDKRADVGGVQISEYGVLAAAVDNYTDISLSIRALEEDAEALEFVPCDLKRDKRLVLRVVERNGHALEHAGEGLQNDPDVVLRAVTNDPGALRFAGELLLSQQELRDRAGLRDFSWLSAHDSSSVPVVVMSVRYALNKKSSAASTYLQIFLSEHPFFKKFRFYNPNAFSKRFCKYKADGTTIDWDACADGDWKCRGRLDGAEKCGFPEYCGGRNQYCPGCKGKDETCTRPCKDSCWRYSFRWHQQLAKNSRGFMLQVVETGKLGPGQELEDRMAEDIGLRIFRIAIDAGFNATRADGPSEQEKIVVDKLAVAVKVSGFGLGNSPGSFFASHQSQPCCA